MWSNRLHSTAELSGGSLKRTQIIEEYHGGLDSIGGTRILTLRSRIAQVCQDPHHSNIVPPELHLFCFINALGATFSQVDGYWRGADRILTSAGEAAGGCSS